MTPVNKEPHRRKGQDRKKLGERLREAREYMGFSQEDVATYLGVPRSALSLMESGQRKVDVLELKKLAVLYKHSVDHFTGEESSDSLQDADVKYLARKFAKLSSEDLHELTRFADFLRTRKKE